MRNYEIYLVEEEFASHYFGRELKLYQLFLEYNQTSSKKSLLLQKQIEFITRPIPSIAISQLLEATLQIRKTDFVQNNRYDVILSKGRSWAELVIYNRKLVLNASGTYDAETIFFEILRKYSPCFLAMDYEQDRYGWLNPIKERKFV